MNFHEDEAKNNEDGTCENSGYTRISNVKQLINKNSNGNQVNK